MKKAIGYIRVSTDGQVGDDCYGIESQRIAIEEYALKNDFEIVRWAVDEGVSGCCENPPQLTEIMFGNVTNPPYEAVIAFKSDRIARDTKLYFYRLYELERKGIKLISTQESFEDDALANIYRAILMFTAEQERKNINLRTANGRKVKSSKGGYSGGNVPYGYSAKDHEYVINEAEAAVVRDVFAMKNRYFTMNGIAHELNKDGCATRSGGKFTAQHIKNILENEKTYRGFYRYGGSDWVVGTHEPILPRKDN